MTTTYTNITLIDVEPDEAAAWLAENGATAAVSPAVDDLTAVYENTLADHADDEEPLEALLALASEISYELGCAAWLVIVDEDDALIYTLYRDGEPVDGYGVRTGEAPEGGDADTLAALFDAPKRQIKVIRTALNRPLDRAHESATDRLRKLLDALVLPDIISGYDYARVTSGDVPSAFRPEDLIMVTTDDEDEA